MTLRPSSDIERAQLKAAFRKLVRKCGGGECAAEATRVGQPALSRYGSNSNPNDHAPIDVVLDLCLDSDDDSLIRTVCRMVNGAFVSLPKQSLGPTTWTSGILDAVSGTTAAADAICRALNAGEQVTAQEIADQQIIEKLQRAIEALVVLRLYADQVAATAEAAE